MSTFSSFEYQNSSTIDSSIEHELLVVVEESVANHEVVHQVLMTPNVKALLAKHCLVQECARQATEMIETMVRRLADASDLADGFEFFIEGQAVISDQLHVCAVFKEEEIASLLIGLEGEGALLSTVAGNEIDLP